MNWYFYVLFKVFATLCVKWSKMRDSQSFALWQKRVFHEAVQECKQCLINLIQDFFNIIFMWKNLCVCVQRMMFRNIVLGERVWGRQRCVTLIVIELRQSSVWTVFKNQLTFEIVSWNRPIISVLEYHFRVIASDSVEKPTTQCYKFRKNKWFGHSNSLRSEIECVCFCLH